MFTYIENLSLLEGNKLKGVLSESGKKVTTVPFVSITSADLPIISDKWYQYKGIVFSFVGDVQTLAPYHLDTTENKIVFVMNFGGVDQLNAFAPTVPSFVDLIVDFSLTEKDNIPDLRTLISLSVMYPTLRFVGTDILLLDGLRVGYCDWKLLSIKEPMMTISNGLDGIYTVKHLTDFSEYSFTTFRQKKEAKIPKPRAEKVVRSKKEKSEAKPKSSKYDLSIFNL